MTVAYLKVRYPSRADAPSVNTEMLSKGFSAQSNGVLRETIIEFGLRDGAIDQTRHKREGRCSIPIGSTLYHINKRWKVPKGVAEGQCVHSFGQSRIGAGEEIFFPFSVLPGSAFNDSLKLASSADTLRFPAQTAPAVTCTGLA